MFETKKKVAALERESASLKDELSKKREVAEAATEFVASLGSTAPDPEPGTGSGDDATRKGLLEAREAFIRLACRLEGGGETPGSGGPLLTRIESRLSSYGWMSNEKELQAAKAEKLEKALVATLDALPDDALKEMAGAFPVYPPSESTGGKAWVTTAFCSLGGCEYRGLAFDTYHEALVRAAVLEAAGEKVEAGCACPDCYAEYMRDCA